MVEGSWVWDLCCGSGAFGIECLSAGAAGCTFVDMDRKAVRYVSEALDELGGLDRARLLCGDVTGFDLSKLDTPGLVFVDPPYSSIRIYDWAFSQDWGAVLEPGGIVLIETPSTLESNEGWTSRRYGTTSLLWRWK
jgi:16S rRNA (guanine966-N2)-methyltransferase